jgi:hypothetical protein
VLPEHLRAYRYVDREELVGGTARPDEERAAPGRGMPGSMVVEQGTLFGQPVPLGPRPPTHPPIPKELQLSEYERFLFGVPRKETA